MNKKMEQNSFPSVGKDEYMSILKKALHAHVIKVLGLFCKEYNNGFVVALMSLRP